MNFAEFDGSDISAEFVRKTIKQYISHAGLKGGIRVAFIDAADMMPTKAQEALHKLIEDHSNRVRFILAANDFNTLIRPILSRLVHIGFNTAPSDRNDVLQRLMARYERVLTECGITYDGQRLRRIIADYHPDLRAVANKLEYEFGGR
jgi:DNA polymerase III delta prime subunit